MSESTNETSYYTEMGFPQNLVTEAFARFGADHNARIDWLLLNAEIGIIPKKLKLTDKRMNETYYDSHVTFRNRSWTVDNFDKQHALVRLRRHSSLYSGFNYTWVHISQPDIIWNVIHHNRPNNDALPSITWCRKVGTIHLPIHAFKASTGFDFTLDDISTSNNSLTADHRLLINAIVGFRKRHTHIPNGPRPRFLNESYENISNIDRITHDFRIELMSYFVKLLDIYQIPESIFTKRLLHCMTFQNIYEKVLPLFPINFQPQRLIAMIRQWTTPTYHLAGERDRWISKRLPIVDFQIDYGASTPENISIDVFFNDMTFVKQSKQPPRSRSNMQRCFQILFRHLNGHEMSHQYVQMDSNFWGKTMVNCQALCTNEVFALTKIITSNSFISKLLPFQKRALNWLQWRETEAPSISSIGIHRHQLSDGFTFYHNHFGELQHTPPPENIRGGILAQDVGLGKTVEMLALIASSSITKPTLVIMPASMLNFWSNEAETHVPSLNTYKYHGGKRNLNDIDNINIVFTTFRIVNDDVVGNMSGNYLQRIEWGRIVVDETHLYSLNRPYWVETPLERLRSKIKWCLSATPFVKEMKNVEVMFRFFGIALTNGGMTIDKEFQTRNANIIFEMLGELTYCQTRAHVADQLPESVLLEEMVCKNQHVESYNYLISAIRRDIETHRSSGFFFIPARKVD